MTTTTTLETTAPTTIFDYLLFAPTTEQARFLFEIGEFMASGDDCFILRGSAGTGKTSVAKAVVDSLNAQNIPCLLSAPTVRAARIIGRKTGRTARTIHSRIYQIDPQDDGRVLTTLKPNDDRVPTLYIVDEASMISDRVTADDKFVSGAGLLSNFIGYVKSGHPRSKLLFIGDVYQLPPIGYDPGQTPPALSLPYLREHLGLTGQMMELTDVQRQAEGSAILRSATSLREAMRLGASWRIESEQFWGLTGAVSQYVRAFDPRRLDAVAYIAPYHASLNQFNGAVRARLGLAADPLTVGDVVLFCQSFVDTEHTSFNGDFGTVVALVSGPERFGELHFQQITVELTDEQGDCKRVSGRVCLEFLQAAKPELDMLMRNALYAEVMRTDRAFRESTSKQPHQNPYLGAMQLRYGYGLTAHKAQGSEFGTVLLNTWTPPGGTANLNYLYTGVTRARERLICSR